MRRNAAGNFLWAITSLATTVLLVVVSAAPAAAITIPTVPVGDAGNAADTSGLGAVGYNYSIGTTEVTNAQYAAFLNAKAASDPLGLYNTNMGSNARGGISRTGSDGSYTYATRPNMADKPVNYVSWYDAARFTNWLDNGQGSGDTETGAYTLQGGTATPLNGATVDRNSGATWVLPTHDEWYKAAYYQPAAQGGDTDDYWAYATATNVDPTKATADAVGDVSNPGSNVANYGANAEWNAQHGNVTTVGSAGSASYYGTYDQSGNVFEWNEDLDGTNRVASGGAYNAFIPLFVSSTYYGGFNPTNESADRGFRVATVPEPGTAVLAISGCVFLFVLGRRRK